MSETLRGVYRISNAKAPVVFDLWDEGNPDNGTHINAAHEKEWLQARDINAANQFWLVKAVKDKSDTYTLRNLKGGTYMDLFSGSTANGATIGGWQRVTSNLNQNWVIRKDATLGFYRIQNEGSKTFADLANGSSADGTKIQGYQDMSHDSQYMYNQLWSFQRISFTSQEVNTILRRNSSIAFDFKTYQVDGEYLVFPAGVLQVIWDSTDLKNRPWREEIFDCDDFAAVFKGAVARWSADALRADGVSILCGIMLGRSKTVVGEGHAYNFTLTDDRWNVRFFEPQNNRFYDDIGYNAFLGYF